MQKKNPDASPSQPESSESQLPLDGSILESTPSISGGSEEVVSEPVKPSLPDIKRFQFEQAGAKANKKVQDRSSDIFLKNTSAAFQDSYINSLSQRGFNKDELTAKKNSVNEGRKLIEDNTPSPYQPSDVPVDEVKQAYNIGRGNLLIGDNDAAIESFSKSLEGLSPEQVQRPERQITQDSGTNIYNEQALSYEADKNPSGALYGIGQAYLNKGEDANAQNFFIQALEEDSGNAEALVGMANIAYKQGNQAEVDSLLSEAQAEYSREALTLQYSAEKTADIEKQRIADEAKGIADALEVFIKGDPEGKMGVLGKMTPHGFLYHNVKEMAEGAVSGVKMFAGGFQTAAGVPGGKAGDQVKGALEGFVGTGSAVFSLIPQVAVFNSFIQPIKEAEELNPDDEVLSTLSTAIDVPFSLASHIAEWTGNEGEEGSTKKLALEAADLILMMGLGAGAHKGVEAYKSKSKAKALAKKFDSITAKEFKSAAIEQGKPELAEAIDKRIAEVNKKREALGHDTPTYVDDLPMSVLMAIEKVENGKPVYPSALEKSSDILYKKYKELGEERNNPKRIQTIAEIDAIREQIGKDIEMLEAHKEKIRADAEISAATDKLVDAEALGEELDGKPGLETLKEDNKAEVDALKAEVDEKVDAEALRVEEEAIKQANRAELESALKDPEVSDLLKGKIKEQLEALKSEKRKEGVYAEALRKGEERDIEPVEAEPDGARADVKYEAEMREMKTSEDADRLVSEKSESRVELAEAYGRETERVRKAQDEIGRVIDERGWKISLAEYTDHTGNSWKDISPAERKYIDKDPSARKDIDTRMEEINGTVADFIDHVSSRGKKATVPRVTELKTNLRNRYRDITKKGKDGKGQELTPSEAKRILESEAKKIDKRYGKYIDKEYRSYEEAKRDYDEAIESGAIHIEGAETVSIPSSGKGRAEGKVAAKEVVKKAEPKVEAKGGSPKTGTELAKLKEKKERLESYRDSMTSDIGKEAYKAELDAVNKKIDDILKPEKKVSKKDSLPSLDELLEMIDADTGKLAEKKGSKEKPKPKEKKEGTGVTHAAIEEQRKKHGLPSLEKIENMSYEELGKVADDILKNNPDHLQKRLSAVYEGAEPTSLDRTLFGKYLAELNVKLDKGIDHLGEAKFNEMMDEFGHVQKVLATGSSEFAKAMRDAQEVYANTESLSKNVLEMRDAMGVEVLSKAETKKVEKKWNEKEAARRDFEKMRDEVSDLERRLVAAETLAALSKSRSKSKKHTKSARSVADTIRGLKSKEEKTTIKDEYGNDIKSDASTQGISMNDLIEMVALAVERVGKLADAIVDVKTNLKGKDWYKNLSGEKKDSINKQLDELEAKSKRAVSRSNRDIDFETFNEGINKENLKDVNSLIGDQVDAGIKGLDAVLKNVTEIIGSEKVKESDILDVLNGSYAEKKIRSQLSVDMSNLRTEAKLLKEIDRILSGEAKPQSEMKVKTRQHLLDLKLKVQNLRKDIGELDIAKIDAGIKRNKKEVERLQERMDTQSFYPEKRPMLINNKEIRKRHPKEMKSLDESADVLHDKRLDLEIMRMDAEKKRRSFPDKIRDAGYEAIRTSAMTVAGVMDYSVAGVHLAPAMFESPLKFVKNFAESIPESLSPKKYRQAVLDMKMNKEFYELAEKSEVAIIDLDLISEGHNKHSIEMQLGKTAYDRMKFSRKMDKLLPKKLKGLSVADVAVKPFQRHFVSMGNKMRLDMFADKIKGLVKEGKTFESHPAEYKKMAMIVNALSGRSKLDASFKNDLVTYGVWSPPKWASALNLLGVSDAYAMFKKENKGFYNELVFTKDKAVRKEVLKSVVSMYMTDQVITGLAKLGGAYVDDDPLSVFYGHIIFPATEGSALKNDFHWDRGNFVYSTLRGINQMIAGEVHREGKVVPTDASKIIPKMLRGKTTPISGSAINLALGKDYIGKKATLKGEALKQITPMTMDQIVSSFRYEDIQALRFMLPLFSGMPMRSQAGWDEAQEEIRMQKVEDSSDPKVAKEKVEKKAKDLDVLIEYNRKQAKYHGK